MFLLAGLLVWAAHFFGVYIIGSLFPGTELARWLVLGITLLHVEVHSTFVAGIRASERAKKGDYDSVEDKAVRTYYLLLEVYNQRGDRRAALESSLARLAVKVDQGIVY